MAKKLGRPPNQIVIGPEASEKICELWLQGQSARFILDQLQGTELGKGLTRQAVFSWIDNNLRPIARQKLTRHIGEFLSELQMLKAWAYRKLAECDEMLYEETIERAAPEPEKPAAAAPGQQPQVAPYNDPAKLRDAVKRRGAKGRPGPGPQDKELPIVRRMLRLMPNNTAGGFLDVIRWCMEQEAKIAGHFSKNNEFALRTEFRVGGLNPETITEQLYDRIRDKVRQLREDRAAIARIEQAND